MEQQKNKYLEFPEGIKKTVYRKHVWNVLQEAERPLTVPEIITRLEPYNIQIWQSTIYRNLDSFIDKGLVRRTFRHGVDMAMFELVREEHKHYATCIDCQMVIPLDECPLDIYTQALEKQDFTIKGHTLEIYGYCDECRDQQSESSQSEPHKGCCNQVKHEH